MLTKQVLENLYIKDKRSMQEIADKLSCSLHKVQYWLEKHKIPIRTRSESLYVKYNPNGDPFLMKEHFNQKDYLLLGLGLGLWWGEGTKKNREGIRLGNSDPLLIKKFLEFLCKICGTDKSRFHFGLQIFSDMDPDEAKDFWVKALDVSPSQFYPKIIVTRSGKIGTYREKTQYGVLTVYFSNVKLRRIFDDLMQKYAY